MKVVRVPRLTWLVGMSLLAGCSAGALVPPTTSSPLTATTTTPPAVPAVDVSATPGGWVPIDYGDAQVSVPATFPVSFPGWPSCGSPAPGIYLGSPSAASNLFCTLPKFRRPTRIFLRLGRSDVQLQHPASQTVIRNGLRLYLVVSPRSGKTIGYEAPALNVEVLGSGPLAHRILATLTRSPRAVALASGSAPLVPAAWRTVTFQGLEFGAPRPWPVTPTEVTGQDLGQACGPLGVTFTNTEVALSTDLQPFPVTACIDFGPPLRRGLLQLNRGGVEVDAHLLSDFPLSLTFSKHCLHIHGLTACPATTPAYSILVLRVSLPGRTTPMLVSIGLAGNGMVARTILYSLRAA